MSILNVIMFLSVSFGILLGLVFANAVSNFKKYLKTNHLIKFKELEEENKKNRSLVKQNHDRFWLFIKNEEYKDLNDPKLTERGIKIKKLEKNAIIVGCLVSIIVVIIAFIMIYNPEL